MADLPPGVRNMVPPSFYRTPYFPYSGLDAQLQDALGLAGRGAGQYGNMNTPMLQGIRNAPANMGGGLLGMSVYGNNPFARSGGYTPPPGGPAGTPAIPGGYAPGAPMTRGGPPGGSPPPPTGGFRGAYPGGWAPSPFPAASRFSPAGSPAAPASSRSAPAGGAPGTGYGGSQGSGGLLAWQNAQQNMGADEKARLGQVINQQGQYDPGMGGKTPTSQELVSMFNALPEDRRGDFINAWDQWSIGKVNNGGAQLQQALRDYMGKGAFDNWYATNVQNKQGSNITSLAGLPSFLQGLK